MVRLVKRTADNFTNISNQVLRDERLSWKARGIFAYMWSQADNWQFYVGEIEKHATDGRKALANGLKELEKYGYLERKHRIAKHGGFDGMDWILTDKPVHQAQNYIDAEKNKKPGENGQNVSDTKGIGYKTYQIQKGTLRNNNSKNEQDKEITTVSNQYMADQRRSLAEQCREVIEYLNKKAGKKFRPNVEGNRKFIYPRLKEGYSVDDLKQVIDNKVADWKDKTWDNGKHGNDYLRPKTLFAASNIEGYLTETPKKHKQSESDRRKQELDEIAAQYPF